MASTGTYMAQAIRKNISQNETFHMYFHNWISEQDQHLQELISASKNHEHGQVESQQMDHRILCPLIEQVIQHYEQYYMTKSTWASKNIIDMFNPTWRSSLEDAFMWIGGWRPSMVFHLLYSKSGLQLEDRFTDIIQGLSSTGDLGDLSPSQLEKVNELQMETVKEEKILTEKLAKQQETVADSTMVDLSHAMTDLMREGEAEQVMDEGRVDSVLRPKEEALVEILQTADDLRLETLKNVLNILSPIQGVHFLIAAAELHLRFHEWGINRDARPHQHVEHVHGQQHLN